METDETSTPFIQERKHAIATYPLPANTLFLYWSGRRESNPGSAVPNREHYHYATPRMTQRHPVDNLETILSKTHSSPPPKPPGSEFALKKRCRVSQM